VSIPLLLSLAAGMLLVGSIASMFLPHETAGMVLADTLEDAEKMDLKEGDSGERSRLSDSSLDRPGYTDRVEELGQEV